MEKFAYDIEPGAIMDFVEDRFMLVIKDDVWEPHEIEMARSKMDLTFCYTQDIAIFILEGGSIDSSDFYFNIQDCDWKEALLNQKLIDVELLLVDQNNNICLKKRKTLSAEQSETILQCLKKQADVQFMPNEYDINVMGIQSAYEPFELTKYAVVTMKF